jgi:hypothetical protein
MASKKDNADKGILVRIREKVTSVSGIITGICAITAFLWMIFKQVNSYNDVKDTGKADAVRIDSLTKRLGNLEKEIDNFNKAIRIDRFELGITYEIAFYSLKDYWYDGIKLKESLDGKKFYYVVRGALYRATWDWANNRYSYIDEFGQVMWCE